MYFAEELQEALHRFLTGKAEGNLR